MVILFGIVLFFILLILLNPLEERYTEYRIKKAAERQRKKAKRMGIDDD